MNILVACEESQAVCKAFRDLGHEAYSCDIQECSGGHPEWHIQDDALKYINGDNLPTHWKRCAPFPMFLTQDGKWHTRPKRWDLIVAHPPCTYLTHAGAVRLFDSEHKIKDIERDRKGWIAAEFFMAFYNAECEHIAIENPAPMKRYGLPKYDQVIEPYQFGDPWKKRTCLWLKGLPKLRETNVVEPIGLWTGSTSARLNGHVHTKYKLQKKRDPRVRSRTFQGIARAMAEQWGVV